VLIFLSWVVFPALVLAHKGELSSPQGWWTTWSWEPGVILSLVLSGWLYGRGVRLLWSVSSLGHGLRRWEVLAFAGGWLSLWVALVSPLHALGQVLFSVHMTQHEVLMLVAAPLLVLGRPLIAFMWGLPLAWRRTMAHWSKGTGVQAGWHIVTTPLIAWLLHAAALWVWHAPVLFQATLASEFVHTLQHCSFLFSALLFWWALIHGRHRLMRYGAAVLYVFTTSIHSGALGALLTFASTLWYPAYQKTTAWWGLTPLEDQQLGGLIMWVPAGVVYLIAGLILFTCWLREAEEQEQQQESHLLLKRA